MSADENRKIEALTRLMQDQNKMLMDHMKRSTDDSNYIKRELSVVKNNITEFGVHHMYMTKSITDLNVVTKDLVSDQNKLKGIAGFLIFIGFGFLIDVGKRMFS